MMWGFYKSVTWKVILDMPYLLTNIFVHVVVSWLLTQCSLVGAYQLFGGRLFHLLHTERKQYVPSEIITHLADYSWSKSTLNVPR
jgi:hypothetical protein